MLNNKQKRFVDEYCKDLNATQSAIRAGYSEKTANVIAYEILNRVEIKAEIEKRLKEKSNQNDISVDMIISELKKIAFNNSLATRDRLKALELLGKYLKMFTYKIEADTKISTNEPIKVVFDKELKEWAN